MTKRVLPLFVGVSILVLSLLVTSCNEPPEEILFVIDNSSSMTEPAGYPEDPRASRWQVVQRLAPEWLSRIPEKTLVGAVSVGGDCAGPSAIALRTGADRAEIASAIRSSVPNGGTPLNAVLKAAPALFDVNAPGRKRIALFSDGLNTCGPNESTCEIVRELHRNHGIVVDVIAWVTEPSMIKEFQCVAANSGGTFSSPSSLKEIVDLPFLDLDPWRYVVLVLGSITLMLSALILYRHAYYAMKWSTGSASTVATAMIAAGMVALYLVLFARTGWVASMLGLVVIAAAVGIAIMRSGRASRTFSTAGLLIAALVYPASVIGQTSRCSQVAYGPARYHHILALDMSGTVSGAFNEMKALVSCYASMYTAPGEEVSLVVFGLDALGSIREMTTFTVPQNRSTYVLNRILDDLEIQNPTQTRTYFKPLADYFNQRLKTVRLEPVMLVVSDGKSDAWRDAQLGRVNFREIPFESFGKRGIYSLPGVSTWRIAVQGGAGLDLTLLAVNGAPAVNAPQRLSPPIEECLVDPDLVFETAETVTLKPNLNPFSKSVQGTLSLKVRNECVSRFRSFRVGIRRGNETQPVGAISNMSINPEPSDLNFTFQQDSLDLDSVEAVVQVVLDQGNTERTIYSANPSRIVLKQVSYISAYGLYWGSGAAVLLAIVALFIAGARRRTVRESNRPQLIGVMGGTTVALGVGQRVELGGAGCPLQVPGVGEGVVLGTIESTATRGKFLIQAADGFRMKVSGFESVGASDYSLGTPLQFAREAVVHELTVYDASGSGVFTGSRQGGSSFGGFDGFRDLGHASSTQGVSSGSDSYI